MSTTRKRRSLLGGKPGSSSAEPAPPREAEPDAPVESATAAPPPAPPPPEPPPPAPPPPVAPFARSFEPPTDPGDVPTEEITQSDPFDAPPPRTPPPVSRGKWDSPEPEPERARAAPPAEDAVYSPGVVYEDVSPQPSSGDVTIGLGADQLHEGLGPPSLVTEERLVAEARYQGAGTAPTDTTDASWGQSVPMMRAWQIEGRPEPERREEPPLAAAKGRRSKPFGRTDDPLEDNPPTEEMPIGGVLSDLAPPIGAPVSVPDAPAIPGILDRYTPASVNRTDMGQRHAAGRPRYLADEPDREETPKPAPKAKPTRARDDDEDAADQGGRGPGPLVLIGGIVLGVSVIALLVGAFAIWVAAPDKGSALPGIAADEPHSRDGIKVRGDMKAPPPVFGTTGTAAPPPDGVVPPPGPIAPAQVAPSEAPPAPESVAPVPAPVAAPVAPKPAPVAPKPVAPKPVADSSGTLSIKSNRRVLVYVNGSPVGYAPTSYKGKPGTYSVSAMVPGQPETKQTRDAKIDAAGATETVNFQF